MKHFCLTSLFLTLSTMLLMADPITLSGTKVDYRGHDLDAGTYTVQYTSANGYQVSLTYTSDAEAGTFSDEIDIWSSQVVAANGDVWYVNSGNITVALNADQSYDLTGTIETVDAVTQTVEQQFVLDLHRGAPMQPKSTVNYTATATWSHQYDAEAWTDVASFDAVKDGVSLHFAYNAWAAYTGEMEQGLLDASTAISHGGNTYAVERLESGEVTVNTDKTFSLTATVLFQDTILYNISLTAPIPVPTDTLNYELSGLKAEVNPMSQDLELHVEDANMMFTVYQQNGVLADGHIEGQGVSGSIDDLVGYDSYLTYYVSADVYVSNPDSQVVVADMWGSNGTLYHVTMTYVLPTALDTIDINIPGATFTNMDNAGQYRLTGSNADYQAVQLTMQLASFEQGECLQEMSDINDYMALDYSYVQAAGSWENATFLKGECSFCRDENDSVTFMVNALASDAHYYRIVLGGNWERRHLDEDCQSGDVNFAFTGDDDVELDIAPALNWQAAYFEVTDQAERHSLALNFYIDPELLDESDLKLPEATYEINSSYNFGTCQASEGVQIDYLTYEYYVTPCLFVEQPYADDANFFNYYFLVDGTVRVYYGDNDELYIAVDAYNSYGKRVEVTYSSVKSAVENTEAAIRATKRLENGQIVIIRDGQRYTVTGVRL